MKDIVAIVNQKGGSGKTTTAHTLGVGLRKRGYRVLLIDLDGQANLTSVMRGNQEKSKLLEVLCKGVSVKDIIQKTSSGDIVAGCEELFHADMLIVGDGKEYRLNEALSELNDDYDYIIIDTPPALNILTVNALVASNSVIITSQAEWFSLSGIERVGKIVDDVRGLCNIKINVKGILLTRFKERTKLNKAFSLAIDKVADILKTKVFKSTVRDTVTIGEAQAKYLTVIEYAPTSNVAKEYEGFIDEFLQGD